MKYIPSFLAAMCLLAGASLAPAAQPDLAKWPKVATVSVNPLPIKGLVEVELPPEALAAARGDLDDLRLMDAGGQLVPCVVRVDRGAGEKSVEYAPLRLLNPTFVTNTRSSMEVDFGKRELHTAIAVQTQGTNFRRRVQVEASADSAAWEMLKPSDWLFRINDEGGSYEKSTVALPANNFQFLRITVFNAPDDPTQVHIEKVTAWRQQFTPPETVEAKPAAIAVQENARLKATEIEIDMGFENMPVCDITPAFNDANFVRRTELLVRNARTRTVAEPVENSQPRTRVEEEPWIPQAMGGILYRLPGGQGQASSENTIAGLALRGRFLLLRIYNGDDAPLKFAGLKVRRYRTYLAFRAESAGACKLFLGNADAPALHFDLENIADRLRTEGVTAGQLGALEANPLFVAPVTVVPWSERHAGLLWAALGVVLVILLGLVAWQMRGVKGAGPAKEG